MSLGIDYDLARRNALARMQQSTNPYNPYQRTTSTNQSVFNKNQKTSAVNTTDAYDGNTCTDGEDDGKINFFSKIGNAIQGVGKAIGNCFKGMFFDENGKFSIGRTFKTVAMAALCFVPVVGPAISCGLAAYGIYNGVNSIVTAAVQASNATTDAEAKAAWENIGGGAFTTAMSVVGLKGSAGLLKGQLTGAVQSNMVAAIKNGSGWKAIGKGMLTDMKNNVVAAGRGIKNTCKNTWNKLTNKTTWTNAWGRIKGAGTRIGGYFRKPSQMWIDFKGSKFVTNLKQKVSNYEKGFDNPDYTAAKKLTRGEGGTYTAEGVELKSILDDNGQTIGYSYEAGGKTYTYNANGRLENVSYKGMDGFDVVDEYGYFGRKKSTTTTDGNGVKTEVKYNRLDASRGKKTVTNPNDVAPDGESQTTTDTYKWKTGSEDVKTSSAYEKRIGGDKTETYTVRQQSNGTKIKVNPDGSSSGTIEIKAPDGKTMTVEFTKASRWARAKYTIDGVDATTFTQKALGTTTRVYNYLENQRPLMFGGPTFGELTNIRPGSWLNDANIQQMITSAYLIKGE